MTITIPIWVLWAVGLAIAAPVLIALIAFAYIGFKVTSRPKINRWRN